MEKHILLQIVLSLGLLVIVGFFFKLYASIVATPRRLRRMLERQGIRGPRPALFTGNILEMKKSRVDIVGPPALHNSGVIYSFLQEWRRQYGDIYTFSLGNKPVVVVNKYDVVKELITCTSLDLGKPSYQAADFEPLLGNGIITSNGKLWASQRKILAPELFSDKVKGMTNLMQQSALMLIDSWKGIIDAEGGKAEISIVHHLKKFSGDLISRACFGSSYAEGEQLFQTLKSLQQLTSKKGLNFGIPGMRSGRLYAVDTMKDPRAPSLHKVVEPEDILEKTGCAYLHTSHCLASGEIMVSALGDKHGNARGSGFFLLDSDFNVKGRWEKQGHSPLFGHDFWYQPRQMTMISTAFAAPFAFTQGFKPEHVADGHYGRHLHVYDWPGGELKQILDLGHNGLVPIQLKFLHDPTKDTGFVGCALSGNVVRFFQKPDGTWDHEVSIGMKAIKVQNWFLPEMPSLVCDIVISLDDRFLYLANWFHGDVRQYDIRDPTNPRLTGQAWVGGLIYKGSSVMAIAEDGSTYQVPATQVKGQEIRGGPHMLQPSLDGKRLYVTNSLFSTWDRQFFPELVKKGGQMLQIDVDTDEGGLVINPDFLVDFGAEPDGPSLAHEMRYPGGDCTSDIWI